MIQRLIIAEKPSLAREIAKAIGVPMGAGNGFFGDTETTVTWCVGHLLEQAKPDDYGYAVWRMEDLPIIPKEWKVLPKKETQSQLKTVCGLIRKAKTIINAGDPDKEGQLLVDEVIEYAGGHANVLRLWVQDLTPQGIQKAFQKLRPNTEYRPFCDAAIARSRSDWLIGMNLTRGYTLWWRKCGGQGALHVGRVQTPTLGLVVRRDRAIESFVPKDYFTGLVRLRHAAGTFVAKWISPKEGDGIDESGKVIRKDIVDAVLKKVAGQQGQIAGLKTERKKDSPPLPYTLADLQKDAGKELGLSPADVLAIAQSLYEKHKVTTYPRTDCPYLPDAEHQNAPKILENIRNAMGIARWTETFPGEPDTSRKSPAWDDKKLGAHHGLIPTAKSPDFSQMSSQESQVYLMVVRRYVAQFYPVYVYDSTSVTAVVNGESFAATGQVVVDLGWRVLYGSKEEKKEKDDPWQQKTLPEMKEKDPVTVVDTLCKAEKTSPPARFDGPGLIEAMEKAHLYCKDPSLRAQLKEAKGIGTEATRAGIIQNLIDRGYIAVQKKKRGKGDEYISTPKGRKLIDIMSEKLAHVDLTAHFEARLEAIVQKQAGLQDVSKEMENFVTVLANEIRAKAPEKISEEFSAQTASHAKTLSVKSSKTSRQTKNNTQSSTKKKKTSNVPCRQKNKPTKSLW